MAMAGRNPGVMARGMNPAGRRLGGPLGRVAERRGRVRPDLSWP